MDVMLIFYLKRCTNSRNDILTLECSTLPSHKATIMNEHHQQEYEAVKQAVLDYAEGVYGVGPRCIERSVHPNLSKGGFFKQDGEAIYSHTSMTYEQMKDLARSYNEDGKCRKTPRKR